MAFRNLHQIGAFYRTPRSQNPPICLEAQETMQLVFRMSRNLPWSHGSSMTLRSAMAVELPLFSSDKRSLSTQVKAPAQARQMIGVDRNDLENVFIQLTLDFLTKQKFEAYDSKGAVVAGDKSEVLVRDIWVFEKSLFQRKAFWRLCGRISIQASHPS